MIKLLKNIFTKDKVDVNSWGEERAVIDLLGEADKEWIKLRYRICIDYIRENSLILDAACGSGFGAELLSEKAQTVYGIDISKDAIDYANQRHKKDNIVFLKGDIKKTKFKNDFFDASISIETLEHLHDRDLYLQELKKLTKNDGRVIISTPQKKSDIPLTPFHIKEYEYTEFKQLLQRYFVIEKIIGLKREVKPIFEKVTDKNYEQFDIYLAICRNIKYIEEDYSNEYYSAVNNGFLINPVGKIYTKALSQSIVGTKVLSIGCGTGILEKKILELNPNLEITGTDINTTPFLDKLRCENGLNNFYIVNVTEQPRQPFDNESFDTVYTSHVLEHVPEPKKFLEESLRLTKQIAIHLVPINLYNPDHIHFFKFNNIDNEFRTQEADIDLKELLDKVISEQKEEFPKLSYEVEVICPRDGSVDYGNVEFVIKREDRPDGLMPCFLIKFYKYGSSTL